LAISKQKFLGFLTQGRFDFVRDSVVGGLGDYEDPAFYSDAARRDHGPYERALLRRCHIVARANRALPDHPDIRIRKRGSRVTFIVADTVEISFKKLDKKLRTRNYPTQSALAFHAQEASPTLPLLSLDDLEQTTHVFAGYVPVSDFATEFELFFTCPEKGRNMWEARLEGASIDAFLRANTVTDAASEVKVRTHLVGKNESADESG